MRLIELQRSSLGLDAPARAGSWESRFAAESTPGIEPAVPERGAPQALLAATLGATPESGVIAGAVVTVSLIIANEGTSAAGGIVVALSLPGAANYRMGSFVRDGRATDEAQAEAFFNEGLPIGSLEPNTRATFVMKVSVKVGTGPLLFSPHIRAAGVPVTGAKALRVERKLTSATAFAGEVQRVDSALYEPKPLIPVDLPVEELPIYELDAEEQLEYEAADAALSSAVQPAAPVEAPQEPVSQAAPPPAQVPQAPEPVASEPTVTEPVASEPIAAEVAPEPPAPAPPVAHIESIVLFGSFDRTTLAFFERTFSGSKAPTLLNHCVFGSALACSLDGAGNDRYRLREHLAAQSQILHRVALHEKLGRKEPIAEYAGSLIAELAALTPQPPQGSPTAAKDTLVLRCDVPEPTHAVLMRIGAERDRWDFVKARQLALALQATGIECGDDAVRAKVENALRHYAQTAMTMLQKLFVRLRIDRSTSVLSQNDAQTDAAARQLLAALSEAF